MVVGVDNVGSHHMQKMRTSLRGEATLLMGKNTMIRKALRGHIEKVPALAALIPYVHGNVGFIFTKGDLADIKKKCQELRVEAPARAGSIAPCDVTVPAGPTGMEPTMTSFLQALNIASKIERGQVAIINDVLLIKKGDKVLPGQATLLQKLNIKPFMYGMVPIAVYDAGAVYDPALLDITEEAVATKFVDAVKNVAALSLELHLPNSLSVTHFVKNAFRNLLAIALETDFSFKQADEFKKAAAAAPAASAASAGGAAATPAPAAAAKGAAPKQEAKKKAPEPEPADEGDGDMGLGLFD
jgi:large subunit ribosomal protein LP0